MKRSSLFGCLMVNAVLGLALPQAFADTTNPDSSSWSEEHAGTPLDLTGYNVVFADEFDAPSITADGGAGPWFAPVHGNYGVATFDTPGVDNQTYSVNDGLLTIRATKDAKGKWHGGNVETVGMTGNGFAQQYGYFEARMKFPNMPGAWPAFWLKSKEEHTNPSMVRPEIDIIEWYGGDPKGEHRTVHLWPPSAKYIAAGGLTKHWYKSNYSKGDQLAGNFHTYGALIGKDLVIIYVDRLEVARFPTFDEYRKALYPLVSLTLYDKDAAKAVSPIDLQVDYVRVYAKATTPNPPNSVGAQ